MTTPEVASMDQFEIHVKQIGKGEEKLSFFIDTSANVLDLKKKISSELQQSNDEDVPTDRQRLIFLGRMLRTDEENLKDARMKTDAVNCIHLTPLPEGAKPSVRDEDGGGDSSESRHLRGARERNRSRIESMGTGFHPFAFAIPARIVLPGRMIDPSDTGTATINLTDDASSSARRSRFRTTGGRRRSENQNRNSEADDQRRIAHDEESPRLIAMIERSIAGSAAMQESTQRLRRAALNQMIANSSSHAPGHTSQARSSANTERSTNVRTLVMIRREQNPRQERAPTVTAPSRRDAPNRSRRRPRETTSEPQTVRRSTRRRGNPDSSS